MLFNKNNKKEIIAKFANKENDTGSVEVQCAILSVKIDNLTEHLKDNHKDFSSRRGLLMLVGRRRRLLTYLKSRSLDRYVKLIGKLGLRK